MSDSTNRIFYRLGFIDSDGKEFPGPIHEAPADAVELGRFEVWCQPPRPDDITWSEGAFDTATVVEDATSHVRDDAIDERWKARQNHERGPEQ